MSNRHRHMMTTPHRPWAVWLALCIALLGALAPTVSHALNWARGGGAGLIEVCTSAGPRWMALADTTDRAATAQLETTEAGNNPSALAMSPDGPLSAAVFDHCPFCTLFADRAAPQPQAWQVTVAMVGESVAPTVPQTHFFPVFYARTPPPRGPPAYF